MRDKRLEEINTDWKLIAFYFFLHSIAHSKLICYRAKTTIIILTKVYDELYEVMKISECWNRRRNRAHGTKKSVAKIESKKIRDFCSNSQMAIIIITGECT